jgi:hypothetical protein
MFHSNANVKAAHPHTPYEDREPTRPGFHGFIGTAKFGSGYHILRRFAGH